MNCSRIDICAAFLLVCAAFDMRYRRIPNRLIICAACIGALAAGTDFIVRFGLAMCISYIISHLRVIGGGDLKMFSVVTGLTGIREFLTILLLGSILCIFIRMTLILMKKETVKDTFPMAPYALLGFVCWRCICAVS